MRVVNLVAFAGGVGEEMGRLVEMRAEAFGSLLERIRRGVRLVEDIYGGADDHGGAQTPAGPATLPAPSRRAYQWLKFLSEEGRLGEHLDALGLVVGFLGRVVNGAGPPVRVDIYHTKAFYRIRSGRDGLRLTISEGFLTAPVDVLEGLVRLALGHGPGAVRGAGRGGRRGRHRARPGARSADLTRLREYVRDEEFRGILAALEVNGGPATPPTQGRHNNLEVVFERVNAAYFEGCLARPVLTWNAAITRRKVGHYEPATDTVMLSLTLDGPAVPDYVVDFVMYHELLHKHLGIAFVNGRQRAHTPAFRKAEKRFPQYARAQEFLGWVGRRRRATAASRRPRDQAAASRRPRDQAGVGRRKRPA